jgi:hypothetical protein
MGLKICFLKERFETHRCSTDENPFHHFHGLYLLNALITTAEANRSFRMTVLEHAKTQQLSIKIKIHHFKHNISRGGILKIVVLQLKVCLGGTSTSCKLYVQNRLIFNTLILTT